MNIHPTEIREFVCKILEKYSPQKLLRLWWNGESIKYLLAKDLEKFIYKKRLHLCEYAEVIGGRLSGEYYRENYILPALDEGEPIVINLDETFGYPSSFADEAFGKLAETYDMSYLVTNIKFISTEEPALIKRIYKYMHVYGWGRRYGNETTSTFS